MSSERRIRASRANGAKSRGPKTPESKARCAASNLKHGILSRLALEGNNLNGYADLLAAYQREFQPQNEIAQAAVEDMAASRCRLMRVWAVERDTMNSEMAKHDPSIDPHTRAALAFRALADGSRIHDVLNRYDVRFDRQFHRSLDILLTARN